MKNKTLDIAVEMQKKFYQGQVKDPCMILEMNEEIMKPIFYSTVGISTADIAKRGTIEIDFIKYDYQVIFKIKGFIEYMKSIFKLDFNLKKRTDTIKLDVAMPVHINCISTYFIQGGVEHAKN